MSEKNRAAVPERQLDSLKAGTHELCKQTETNWNPFFVKNSSCGPVMLSHKQRNDWCTVVSARLGEQIDVEFFNNNSFHLMHV